MPDTPPDPSPPGPPGASGPEKNRAATRDFRQEKAAPLSKRRRMRFHPPTRWLKQAQELLRLPTVSFHEQNVMLWVWRYATNRGMPVTVDAAGNLRVDFEPEHADPDAQRIVFTAHMDHVGLWAVGMSDAPAQKPGRKLLRAHWMGRFPSELMAGRDVLFWTGGKPLSEVEPALVPPGAAGMGGLCIGGRKVRGTIKEVLGFNAEGDVTAVDVEVDEAVDPGSVGTWDLPDPELRDGKLYARAIDDVAGVAALIALLDELRREGARRPVSCLFTRAEEGGFFGAIHFCRENFSGPAAAAGSDILVTVEASKQLADAPVGGGPIVRVGDKLAVFHPELTAWAAACADGLEARHKDFAYRRRLMDGGTCESSVFQAWTGRAGALCVALGNYHNHDVENKGVGSEFIDVADFGNLIRLMRVLVESKLDETGEHAGSFGAFRGWCEDWEKQHRHLYAQPAGTAS